MGERPKPYIMAHRGNSELCPENTLAAFRRALADRADVIETDLHLSADGEIMCIHDATVDRTTDGQGAVSEMTVHELQQLSADYGIEAFRGERIPTLRELLAILPEDVSLGLELKSDDFLREAVCVQLRSLLKEAGLLNRVVALSFSRDRLDAINKFVPEIPTGLITMIEPLPESRWTMIGAFWPALFINPLYVWMGHRRGQIVCPLDPTPEPRLWYYRLLRCDAVLTNNPEKTRQALGR